VQARGTTSTSRGPTQRWEMLSKFGQVAPFSPVCFLHGKRCMVILLVCAYNSVNCAVAATSSLHACLPLIHLCH
jgi:hypothetical protein